MPQSSQTPKSLTERLLDHVEWLGNKLPDPTLLFLWALFIIWLLSSILSGVEFEELDPRASSPTAIKVINQLEPRALVQFLASMVKNFVEFPPLGLVVVALLGVGVAEHAGFVAASLQELLEWTPKRLLTPMLLIIAILSHSAGDSGYVLIIPVAAVMYAAVGRHPLLGITTAFAGVSGGFSANVLPSSLDMLMQGFTQSSAQLLDPAYVVNPLCNWGFMSVSCVVIVAVGWFVSDVLIEPRLQQMPVDDDAAPATTIGKPTAQQRQGLAAGYVVLLILLVALGLAAYPESSPFRSTNGYLIDGTAPLMKAIVPLIFLLFLLPGIAYGYVAGTIKSHRDVVEGMSKAMGTINYYLVMAFFAAQFTYAFNQSNLGVLCAVKGANQLVAWQLRPELMILALIALTASADLFIGSASAKWVLLGNIFVPMLMQVGISPELTQCAYRIGDSSINIVTPLMPYFPLVVMYMQRYVKSAGIGTLVSLMLPYSLGFLCSWSLLLMLYWWAGIPLGPGGPYTYSP